VAAVGLTPGPGAAACARGGGASRQSRGCAKVGRHTPAPMISDAPSSPGARSHQVTWNVSDGWGVQCEVRSVTPVFAEVAEGNHVGRAPGAGGVRPAGGPLTSARNLHQSRGGNSDASRHLGTRSRSVCNGAGDPDRLSHHVRITEKTTTTPRFTTRIRLAFSRTIWNRRSNGFGAK
jgi:hypothetical protein